jgi:hypothetical protein
LEGRTDFPQIFENFHQVPTWQLLCDGAAILCRRLALRSRHYDDWTIESWRIEPRLRALEVDVDEPDQNPPLWKDLTLASLVAAVLWGAAAMFLA